MSKTVSLTEIDILALSMRKEDDLFDRKSPEIDGRGVQKIAVAFANADGGEFIIGIADEKEEGDPAKRWRGVSEPEKFNGHLQALFNLNPTVDFSHEFLSHPDHQTYALRVHIEKTPDVAKTSDGKVYQRKGAQSLPVTDPARIQSLAFAKGARSYEDTILPNLRAEEIVDSSEMARFCVELQPSQEPLAFSINEGLVEKSKFLPNSAGVLLFSDNPPAVFPRRCGVKIVFYDTKSEAPERDHLKINETLGGPIYQLAHATAERVAEIMSGISISTAAGLAKVAYPPEAIWEVLVNALIHRDYSIADDVQLIIYQNRIEIKSPGKLPGFVTEDNYLDVRYSRNPKIVRTLARYKNPPNKDLGEGLNTAFQKMKEWKLSAPRLFEDGNYVRVIISHNPLASPEELVLEFLNNHAEIKNSQARDITGIRSENQMKNVFIRLQQQKMLEPVPGKKGSSSAWRLAPRQEPNS